MAMSLTAKQTKKTELELIQKIKKVFNGTLVKASEKLKTDLQHKEEEENMAFELKGYTPEEPSSSGFEPFKYEGLAVVEKAEQTINEDVDTAFYPKGCTQEEISVTILDGDYAGRKLWKRFNVDATKADDGKKTPVQKLADQLFAVGLSFSDNKSLDEANKALTGMKIIVKAWIADFKDDRGKRQLWNIKGKASDASTKPSF